MGVPFAKKGVSWVNQLKNDVGTPAIWGLLDTIREPLDWGVQDTGVTCGPCLLRLSMVFHDNI